MRRPTLGPTPDLDERSSDVLGRALELAQRDLGSSKNKDDPYPSLRDRLCFGKLRKIEVLRGYSEAHQQTIVESLQSAALIGEDGGGGWLVEQDPERVWFDAMPEYWLELGCYERPSVSSESIEAFADDVVIPLPPILELRCARPDSPREWDGELNDLLEAIAEAESAGDDCLAELQAERNELFASRPWHERWRVAVPVFGPQALVLETVQEFVDWLTVLPDVAGVECSLADSPAIWRMLSEEGAHDSMRLKQYPAIRVGTDVGVLLASPSARAFLSELLSDASRLRSMVGLLALARRAAQPESQVVLALSALEALVAVPKDEQIQKNVLTATSLLYPPAERLSVQQVLKDLYRRRNALVHGRLKDYSGLGRMGTGESPIVAPIADVIRRWLAFALRYPRLRSMTLAKLADSYLTNHDAEDRCIRALCDQSPHPDLPGPTEHDWGVHQASAASVQPGLDQIP